MLEALLAEAVEGGSRLVHLADMSMSLDGYVTGPNDSRENPFGDGAAMLHDWMSYPSVFTFVTDGVASAIDQRASRAGRMVRR